MKEYKIQQKCTVWIQTTVEARSLKSAMDKASEAMENDGDFEELLETFDFTGEYFAMDENRNELKLPKGWA
jgi:hypothetical protein